MSSDVKLRFAHDDDLMKFEPLLDRGGGKGLWPRTDDRGQVIRSWDVHHQLAMNHLERMLRSSKEAPEVFEIGRLSLRSQERLRECAACLALHYLYVAADQMGDENGYLARKAEHYKQLAVQMYNAEALQLDYDVDNDGIINDTEKNQPFTKKFIRG
ncbi:MAG TPA: hypothetical protein VJ891_16925 [Casimicrobiaceae bacterium]|nr:hypothetical protein [Casimicrobiaceae bacterium]